MARRSKLLRRLLKRLLRRRKRSSPRYDVCLLIACLFFACAGSWLEFGVFRGILHHELIDLFAMTTLAEGERLIIIAAPNPPPSPGGFASAPAFHNDALLLTDAAHLPDDCFSIRFMISCHIPSPSCHKRLFCWSELLQCFTTLSPNASYFSLPYRSLHLFATQSQLPLNHLRPGFNHAQDTCLPRLRRPVPCAGWQFHPQLPEHHPRQQRPTKQLACRLLPHAQRGPAVSQHDHRPQRLPWH
jgi:hypothetical protein